MNKANDKNTNNRQLQPSDLRSRWIVCLLVLLVVWAGSFLATNANANQKSQKYKEHEIKFACRVDII